MQEVEIRDDERTNNPFEKRTKTQREKDRQFLRDYISYNPDVTKLTVYENLLNNIKDRGDDYTLEYAYVCTEINKIRKDATTASISDIQSEITRTLDIINDNIALCIQEIQNRFTLRENVETTIEDLTVKDYKGLSIEEIHILNRLQDKIKKRTVKIKKIRAGSDVKEMMDALHMWVKRKNELLGEDAPKKISQKIDMDLEVKQMTYELFEIECRSMGVDPSIIINAIEQMTKTKLVDG